MKRGSGGIYAAKYTNGDALGKIIDTIYKKQYIIRSMTYILLKFCVSIANGNFLSHATSICVNRAEMKFLRNVSNAIILLLAG